MNIDDYVYAAVLSHIGWQQIATGPSYKFSALSGRLISAIGVSIPNELIQKTLVRMANEGLIEIIETGVGEPYFKLNYKPVNEYVTKRVSDKKSAEYVYRTVGKQILTDLLVEPGNNKDEEVQEVAPGPPPSLNEEHRAALIAEIDLVVDKLDAENLSNEVKVQTLAYLGAARTLADSPEPPTSLIWQLLERANQISGIAALFVAIFALFNH